MDNTQLNATAIRRGGIQQLKRTDSIRREERNWRSGHILSEILYERSEEYDQVEAVDTLAAGMGLGGYADVECDEKLEEID
jgi:hypothetical protein